MALSSEESAVLDKLYAVHQATYADDELMLDYYLGQQRVEQLGLAIPPSLRRFLVVVNWPRVLVDTIERRQNVRSLILPSEETADPQLREIWDANNLDAELTLFNTDRLVYGRAFMSVGANEDDPELPLIHVESPREMAAIIDQRKRTITAAARFYGSGDDGDLGITVKGSPTLAVLYLPNSTVWVERSAHGGEWVEVDRNDHQLGRVPVVMHLNRRRSGSWEGESELRDIIPLTDSAARTLTNLQFSIESHGIPRMWMTGVSKGDFVNPDGSQKPVWEAYFNAIHTLTSEDAKVGQLDAADVSNFEAAVSMYGKQAATVTGFPARYFGLHTTNPPAEGAIRADEAQLVETVERHNTAVGTTLGWAAAIARRIVTGEWVPGNRIRVDWQDPATPTVAQREDALSKRRAAGVLSREGYWDELGWSEARKAKERAYFEAEQISDPIVAATRNLAAGTGNPSTETGNAPVGG